MIITPKYTQDAQKYSMSFPLLMTSRPFDNSAVTVSEVVCDTYVIVPYTRMAQNTFLKERLRNTKPPLFSYKACISSFFTGTPYIQLYSSQTSVMSQPGATDPKDTGQLLWK